MFNALTVATLDEEGPPEGSRRRRARRRLGTALALASALALGFAMMVAPLPAQAATNLDGPWTVVHGGTGQLSLNTNGTYTSTCQVTPGYADAFCPPPTGTFERNSLGSSYGTFHGDDGSTASYRYSGDVQHPDTISSTFASRTYSQLVMKKGSEFVCTDWGDNGYRMKGSPLVYLDETDRILYATGSHQLLGPAIADNGVSLAETAPNYFQRGRCDNLYPELTMASFLHVDNIRDVTSASSAPDTWLPQGVVTIKDLGGVLVSDATVNGLFIGTDGKPSCVTLADGTCTLGNFPLPNSVTSAELYVLSVVKAGSVFMQDPGSDPSAPDPRRLTIDNPLVGPPPPPPPPPPVTHHIGDLDAQAFATSSPRKWEPQVSVQIVNPAGEITYGATVTGTFTHHSGTVTCVTSGAGTCTLGGFTLNRSIKTTVFTVTNVTAASSTYVPEANSDPDGDSNGTSITVKRP